MLNKLFKYKVNLIPLDISNAERHAFRDELNAIPYLLYEVECLATGEKIVINKPGGKRNFGKLSRDDFMVFIYNPEDESLWLISHKELNEDLIIKFDDNSAETTKLIKALFAVCSGKEPDPVISEYSLSNTIGIPAETILKVYKWIWGQEDCNYPKGKGRWLSMDGLLEQFGINKDDMEV